MVIFYNGSDCIYNGLEDFLWSSVCRQNVMRVYFPVWMQGNSEYERQKRRNEMFDALKKVGSAFAEKLGNMKKTVAVAAVGTMTVASSFAAEGSAVTLPDTGVNVADYISKGITTMGAVVAVAVGGYVAFKVVRKALGWINKALA